MPVMPPYRPQQPQQQMQQQPGGGDLYDLLAKRIAESLSGEMPQAPQMPQQQPLSPTAAFAAARNPQFAPMLNQQAQAPEMARYGQQQAAFKAAMGGREKALTAGVGLVGSQMRGNRMMRPQLRMIQTMDAQGNPVTVPMQYDPSTETLSPMETTTGQGQFLRFVPPQILPTTTGFERVPKTGPTGPIQGATTGKTLMPMPSAQMVSDITTQENLRGAFETASGLLTPYLSERSSPARVGAGAVAGLPVVGGMATQLLGYGDPQSVNVKQSLDRVSQILNYLVSGKQISEQEYRRLRPNIPEIGDAPDVAAGKMQRFRQELDRIEQTRGRILPGLSGGGAQAPIADPLLEELWSGGP